MTAPGAVAAAHRILAAGSMSFSLASRLLERDQAAAAAVIYSYCRRVDDAIDRAPPDRHAAVIEALRDQLDEIYGEASFSATEGPGSSPNAPGHPWRGTGDPILAAFAEIVRQRQIPRVYPAELLAGMEMDACGYRYHTWEELILYCHRVAATVGLMMSHVFGIAGDDALVRAAHLGIAMQLTNICRDVAEDWDLGRLYLPREALAQWGLGDLATHLGEPFPEAAREPMRDVVKAVLGVAGRYYASGDEGLCALPWRSALAVRAARLIYAAIGDRIAGRGFDVLGGRAVVPGKDKAVLCARAARDALVTAPGRMRARASFRIPQTTLTFSPALMICPDDSPRSATASAG
ncbi:MAG TPA: phytoene/squalene synthase family protein [Kofleriaceae bacterium]|nr:phytoene/squalene synthase family protein [Kofleriaceae bacterium]